MASNKLNKAAASKLKITAVKKKNSKLYKVFCDEDEYKKEKFNQGGIAEIRAVMKRAQIDYDKWLKKGKNNKKVMLQDLKNKYPLIELVELGAFGHEVTKSKEDTRPMTMVVSCSYNVSGLDAGHNRFIMFNETIAACIDLIKNEHDAMRIVADC